MCLPCWKFTAATFVGRDFVGRLKCCALNGLPFAVPVAVNLPAVVAAEAFAGLPVAYLFLFQRVCQLPLVRRLLSTYRHLSVCLLLPLYRFQPTCLLLFLSVAKRALRAGPLSLALVSFPSFALAHRSRRMQARDCKLKQ